MPVGAPENPAWGHCDVTALLINDIFRGDLVVGEVYSGAEHQGYHWWNRLDSGLDIDLTHSQFRSGQRIVETKVVQRPKEPPRRRYDEYRLMRKRFRANLRQAGKQQPGDVEGAAGG